MTLRESLKQKRKSSETESSFLSFSSNKENSPQSSLYSSNIFLGRNSSCKYKFLTNSPQDKGHVCNLSPSFFLNCSYARPNLSPSIKTPPSNLGSTCMQKYLDSLQSNDEGTTKALTSFNSHVDQMGFLMGNEPVQELSPIICKKEAIIEEKINQNRRPHQKKSIKKDRDEVRKVFKRPSELSKSETENANGSTELTKVLDNIIHNLRGKEEQPTSRNSKPSITFQFSQEDYDFESEHEEDEKELLTEEESIKVLKSFRNKSLPTLQFMAEFERHSKIPNTLMIGEGTSMKKDAEFTRNQKKILAFNKNEISIPLELSKKILKSSGRAAYECKYCGKTFTKGCSLGGHISRLHKGESLDFKQRLQTRNKRVADRVRGKFLKKESVKQLQSLESSHH